MWTHVLFEERLSVMSTRFRTVLAAILVGFVAATTWSGEASATTQAALAAPATPVVSQLTTTSATFTWSAPGGPVANYTVQKLADWSFVNIATTSGTTYTDSGLQPDTVYEYRVVANATAGSGYTSSDPSGVLYLTTRPLPESVPPTKPGTPIVYSISITSATLNFTSSTDNMRVAGYVAQLQVNGVWTDVATNNINTVYLRGLTPNTSYTVVVVAFDPNGNRSPRSDPATFTTRQVTPAPTCKVQLTVFGQNYLLYTTIENMTLAPLDNWFVRFTLPAEHSVGPAFNAALTRTGSQATFSPLVWNTRIGSGGTLTMGFNGSYPVGSPLPSGFSLNGTIPCS
jgi:chitodextrinase